MLNFTWWVNRKDRSGSNVFEGGFLGLDNIGVFDRSSPLPTGGYLEQADGTAWMALFCQNMLEIASELAMEKPAYADMSLKFVEHYLWIASSMIHAGDDVGMWDEEDGFFYDVLRLPDGRAERLKVRSMVGLLPLCAVTVFEGELLKKYPELAPRLHRFLGARPELTAFIQDPARRGENDRLLASVLNEEKLRRVLARMLDEDEFLSPYGIRSISRYHDQHPYVFHVGHQEYRVSYLPAESDSGMFGGNSNWRGPIWMPVNALIIRALLQYYAYYGNGFTIECPTGSGRQMTLYEVAEEIARRLSAIFLRDGDGRRPVYGGAAKFQDDPHWRDLLLFYEYFHGDNGAGLGASHQTGWTGIVARMMQLFATASAEQLLEQGKKCRDEGSARGRSPSAVEAGDARHRHEPARAGARSGRAHLRDPVRVDHGADLHRLDQRRRGRSRGGAYAPRGRHRLQHRVGHRRRGRVSHRLSGRAGPRSRDDPRGTPCGQPRTGAPRDRQCAVARADGIADERGLRSGFDKACCVPTICRRPR